MEMAVSLAVAAIVIIITYTAYRIISKGYLDFNKRNQDLEMLIRLDELLKRDFDQAELIVQIPAGLLIQKDNSNVIYELMESSIVRKSSIIDTFKVKIREKLFSFEGSPVYAVVKLSENPNPETDISGLENSRVDRLDLTLEFKEENISSTYQKIYSSTDLIQRKANAIH